MATLWRTVLSWELNLIADFTTSFHNGLARAHKTRQEAHRVVSGVRRCSHTKVKANIRSGNSSLSVGRSTWKSYFQVMCWLLHSCYSVRTWAGTTDLTVSFSSLQTSVYCVFWMFCLRAHASPLWKLAVTSAMSSSFQDCTVLHNVAIDHCI